MKVSIACGGKWSSFDQAAVLDERGCLGQLLTTYYSQKSRFPNLRRDSQEIAPDRVVTHLWPDLIKHLGIKIPVLRNQGLPFYLSSEAFEDWACKRIDPCDVFMAWASFGRRTMEVAKAQGATTVLCRAAAHVLRQNDLLNEELERNGRPKRLRNFHPRLIQKNLQEYETADYVSVPSKYVADSFVDYGFPASKILHVYPGHDLSHFRQEEKKDDVFRVMYVGRLTLGKGVHLLLEAFAGMDLAGSELCLVGPVMDEIRPVLDKYEGSFRLVGAVPHLQLGAQYSQASVVVLPALHEALGAVTFEAMACGTPVICSRTGAAEAVRDGVDGFVVESGDVEAIRDRLTLMHGDPDLRTRMGRKAIERAKMFSADAYGDRLVGALQNLLNGSPHTGLRSSSSGEGEC